MIEIVAARTRSPRYPYGVNVPRLLTFRASAVMLIASLALVSAACRGGDATAVSGGDAAVRLRQVVLGADDIGGGFTQDTARLQTNADEANARPDTDNARRQYREWGQVLAYNVQYAAPEQANLVYNGRIARVMNIATLYETAGGATAAFAFTRGLSPSIIANVLANEGAGTKIEDTQAVKDVAFPAKGNESFAWRLSGKATFESGLVTAFVADTVFVRDGRVTGSITAVGLGEQPNQSQLEALVDRFVEHARAEAP